MGLEKLLVKLEARTVTPVTSHPTQGVTVKSAERVDCTDVTSVTPVQWDAEDWHAYFNESAGIAEYDGQMSRAEAEAMAYEACISRWMNMNPPELNEASTDPGSYCHAPWFIRKQQEAEKALATMGIVSNYSHLT